MKRKWWCANCLAPIELDRHGRCNACGSDAVGLMKRSELPRTHLTPPVPGNNNIFAALAGLALRFK